MTKKRKPSQPLLSYLDLPEAEYEKFPKSFTEFANTLSGVAGPANVSAAVKNYVMELHEEIDLGDEDAAYDRSDEIEHVGKLAGCMLAKFEATDKFNPYEAITQLEQIAGDSYGGVDTPDFDWVAHALKSGLDVGRNDPFIGEPLDHRRLEQEAIDARAEKRKSDQDKAKRFGVYCSAADLHIANGLWDVMEAGDKSAVLAEETMRSVRSLQWRAPQIIEAYMQLGAEKFGDDFIPEFKARRRELAGTKNPDIDFNANTAKAFALMEARCEFFRDPDGGIYVDVEENGSTKTMRVSVIQQGKPVITADFRSWLDSELMAEGTLLKEAHMSEALRLAVSMAMRSPIIREVFRRAATSGDKHYVDLMNAETEIVMISDNGWKLTKHSPVAFIQNRNMRALPTPMEPGKGDVRKLRRLLNIESDMDFVTVIAWLVAAQRTDSAYVILILNGSAGGAKSTMHRIIRRLIDPNKSDLRTAPKADHDIVVQASNNYVVSYENMSSLSATMQDLLCTVATGGGFSTRELHTSGDEFVESFKRPILINGIASFVTRPDLMQRAVVINPPPITERKLDHEVEAEFQAIYAETLGALLDIHVAAQRIKVEVEAEFDRAQLPRMASFAVLGEAVSRVMGYEAGEWSDYYRDVVAGQSNEMLAHSPVALPLIEFVKKGRDQEWSGTVGDLYAKVCSQIGLEASRARTWPSTAKGFANSIRKITPELKPAGLVVEEGQRTARGRNLHLSYVDPDQVSITEARNDDGTTTVTEYRGREEVSKIIRPRFGTSVQPVQAAE